MLVLSGRCLPPQPLPPKAPVDLAAAAECLKVVSSSEQVRIARRYLHFPQVAAPKCSVTEAITKDRNGAKVGCIQ